MEKVRYPYSALIAARRMASGNWEEINRGILCGCFSCEKIFLASEIREWIGLDSRSAAGATAVCPFCGKASIIAKSSFYPLEKGFLEAMHSYWRDEKARQA